MEWCRVEVEDCDHILWLRHATVGGMSGSPILSDDGNVMGMVVAGVEGDGAAILSGPHLHLVHHLPAWLTN
jgi:hypothetical protein